MTRLNLPLEACLGQLEVPSVLKTQLHKKCYSSSDNCRIQKGVVVFGLICQIDVK